MIDSKILASIIIVACIGVAAAGYQMTQTETPLWDPSSTQDVQTDDGSPTEDVQTDDSQQDDSTELDTQKSGSNTKSASDSGNSKRNNGKSSNTKSNTNGNGNSNGGSGSGSSSGSGTNTNNGGSNTQKKSNSDSKGIGPSQAKSIANNHIEAEGAHAGSAKKTTIGGKTVYYVPVINKDGKVVGDFYIDMNGKVVEASGGA